MKRLIGMGYRDTNGVKCLLGQIAEEQKQWPLAIEWYKQIEEGDNALAARIRTANAIAKQGKLDEAPAYLKRVETENPGEQVQLTAPEPQPFREANRPRAAHDRP